MKMVIIDIEKMIFVPHRKAILDFREYRHKYGVFSDITSFQAGKVAAYGEILESLNLLDAYNKWAYEHRDEVKENAQT